MDALDLASLTAVQVKQWRRLCLFVQKLHAKDLVPERVLLVLTSVSALAKRGTNHPTLILTLTLTLSLRESAARLDTGKCPR